MGFSLGGGMRNMFGTDEGDHPYLDAFSGRTAAQSSERAAQLQAEASRDAIRQQRRFLRRIRRDLSPFREAGVAQLEGLNALISDPNAQLNFIQNNPFFSHLANYAQNRLMNVQAARGRLGSGDTPAALQNQLMLLGSDLVNQSIGQRMNLATMGQNAAAMTGTATQNTGNSITDLITGGANARAAGMVGAGNALTQGSNNLMSAGLTAAGIFLSDRRMKCDLQRVGKLDCGIPVYSFRYVGGKDKVIGVMAQDVESVAPGAVLDVFGVKFVDYSELERVLH